MKNGSKVSNTKFMHGFLLEQDLYPDIFYRLLTDEPHSFCNIKVLPSNKTELFEFSLQSTLSHNIIFFQNNNFFQKLSKRKLSFILNKNA